MVFFVGQRELALLLAFGLYAAFHHRTGGGGGVLLWETRAEFSGER